MKEQLLKKLKNKSAVIGIVGLGYVGLPLVLRYSEAGYKNVIGFDIDEDKVVKLAKGQSYIKHIKSDSIKKAYKKGFKATIEFDAIKDCDAIILCVPTPLNKYREPDLSFVLGTMDNNVCPHIKVGQVVSLESTTYPGTTDEELLPRIEERGFKVGKDFFLVFSPEREDPGNKNYHTQTIPKVVGGYSKNCLEIGVALYKGVIDKVVPVSSTKAAEMTKLLENIHRAVNIGLVNEMKIVADKMGIDIFEVIDAAATKPFGFTAYYPGPGLGGHCIPIDPFYLTWKAREFGVHTRFIELAGEINTDMHKWVVDKIIHALNTKKKALNGSKVLLLGLAYKKNIEDTRESPSVEIMEILHAQGAKLDYSDPHVASFPKMRKHHFDMDSVVLSPAKIKSYDAVVLLTDHDDFDYKMIQKNANIIIDTRGKFDKDAKNVVRA
jgi:UDP-N-acetyl-D-glucosamine dehydrogenase